LPQFDTARWRVISPLLDALLDADEARREAMLAELRRENPALAAEIAALLGQRAAIATADFLEGSAIDFASAPTLAGRVIGNYTLERPLGEGGMGIVWLAKRSDGRFEGYAAVKLLNLGLFMREGAERFRHEGSVLARLTHPNIARLFDAGIAEGGQPYLVLEYVDGEPIDRWCDRQSLNIKARLRLFLDVLAAVAHAHSNLILHRDLKPSNILVAQGGQVKLLDFGIAKLLDEQQQAAPATQQAYLTHLTERAFTLDYAAPEQVQGGVVTMATDVYALGVLLYVLLSGTHPTSTGDTASRLERLHAIVDNEPTRVSDAVLRSSSVIGGQPARRRARVLRGDLDNIIAKALKKAPAERYRSADAMADDIQRYLDGRPVLAQANGAWYYARKFVARHAFAVGATAAVLISLLAGTTVALRQAEVARREARKAQAVQGFLTDVFLVNTYDQPDPLKAQGTTARELLIAGTQRIQTALADAPEVKVEVLHTLGGLLLEFGLYDEAVTLQRNRIDLLRSLHGANDVRVAEALLETADAMEMSAFSNDREALITEAQRIVAASDAVKPTTRAELFFQLAKLLQYSDWPRSADNAKQATALFREQGLLGRAAESLSLQGDAAEEMNDQAAAERAFGDSLDIAKGLTRDRNRVLPLVQMRLASVQGERLKIDDADRNFREAIAAAERLYGREHSVYLDILYNYGTFLGQNSRTSEAVPVLRQVLETHQRTKGDNDAYQGTQFLSLLGMILVEHGRAEAGQDFMERAIELKRSADRNNLALAAFLHLAARAPMETGDIALATAHLEEARTIIAAHDEESGRDLALRNKLERARLAFRANRPAEALQLFQEFMGAAEDPPQTRQALMYRILLAEIQAQNGDVQAATRSSQSARDAIERLGLAKPAAREIARLDIVEGKIRLAKADADGATTLFRRALATRQALLDANSPPVAEAQLELARARKQAGDAQEAKALLRDARAIIATHRGVAPLIVDAERRASQ
jgi:tetratricopeptide (TPR) repeat protein